MELYGVVWRSMEKYGEVWRSVEKYGVFSKAHFRKSMEYLVQVWSFVKIEKITQKSMEYLVQVWRSME